MSRKIRLALELSREKGVIYVLRYGIMGYVRGLRWTCLKWARRARAWALRLPLVHAIGDSHTWSLVDCPMTIVHNIGPATAYNLANPESNGQYGAKLYDVVHRVDWKRDYILLVFGEIDCRVHIYNQYVKSGGQTPISELIDRTIRNYGTIMRRLQEKGIRFGVCGIVPATEHIIRYPAYATAAMRRRLLRAFTGRYPHQATPEIASDIKREFNAKLKRYCQVQGFPYCDIYSKIVDGQGFMKEEYRKDEIHANVKAGRMVGHWLVRELVSKGKRSSIIDRVFP